MEYKLLNFNRFSAVNSENICKFAAKIRIFTELCKNISEIISDLNIIKFK